MRRACNRVPRAVCFRVLEMSEIVCLRTLLKARLLEGKLVAWGLEELVGSTEAHCGVEVSCVIEATSIFV